MSRPAVAAPSEGVGDEVCGCLTEAATTEHSTITPLAERPGSSSLVLLAVTCEVVRGFGCLSC